MSIISGYSLIKEVLSENSLNELSLRKTVFEEYKSQLLCFNELNSVATIFENGPCSYQKKGKSPYSG